MSFLSVNDVIYIYILFMLENALLIIAFVPGNNIVQVNSKIPDMLCRPYFL